MAKIFLLGIVIALASCGRGVKQNSATDSGVSRSGMKGAGMNGTGMNGVGDIHLNEEQIRLGGVRVDTLKSGSTQDDMVFTGVLNFNQGKLFSVNTRVDGRIDRLYVKRTGEYVHKGEPLYDLYSEPLNNAKQEYLHALEEQRVIGNSLINYGAIVESARGKLLLWGMTEKQIALLGSVKEPANQTTFYSPEDGYVTAVNAQEGGTVMEGSAVLQMADLSTLWAEAQVYSTQLSSLDMSSQVSVRIPDLNDQVIPGVIDFVNPEISPDTRINLVRVTIRNPNNRLQPGMPVYITASNSPHHSIVLPNEAVLTDSKGSVVWVQVRPGVYSVRMVQTGIGGGNSVEITSGLQLGEVVVTGGAYLINSEYIFEHGAGAMEGMDMK
jgi:Cu(I)/Ag(I) efflux system membrane fusion protein